MGKERLTRKDELEGIGGESEEGTGDLATLSDFFTHAHVTRMPDWFDFRE